MDDIYRDDPFFNPERTPYEEEFNNGVREITVGFTICKL